MKNILILITSLVALILSNYLGNISPPTSILFTPILIAGIAVLIFYKSNFPFFIKVLFITFFIISNDLLVRTYAGGTADSEGNGWIILFMFLGIFLALILTVFFGITNGKKIELLIVLPVSGFLTFFYFSHFSDYGLVWIQPSCTEIENSKNEKLFVSDLKYSDSIIIAKQDKYLIKKGWIEKEIKIDNRGLKKKKIETGIFNVVIIIKGEFDKYGDSQNVNYKWISITPDYGRPLRNVISFNVQSQVDTIPIYFYTDYFKTLIKKIKMVPKTGSF